MKKQRLPWLSFVLLASLPGRPAVAEESLTPEFRSYDRSIEMHSAPLEGEAMRNPPGQEPKSSVSRNRPSRSDFKWLDQGASFAPIMPYNVITVTPEKKDKNWLRSSHDDPEGENKETKGTGWGWLADDLKQLQQERELSQQKQEDESLQDPLGERDEWRPQTKRPELMQARKEELKEEEAKKPFEPVKTSELFVPTLEDSPDSLLAGRVSSETPEQAEITRGKRARGEATSRVHPGATEPLRIQSGMDEAWGLERTRNPIAQGQEGGLSQTATILKDMTSPSKKPPALGSSSLSLPGSTLPAGFSMANPARASAAGSLFSVSGSSALKEQSLFKPVAGDLGGSSLLTTPKPIQAPLSGLTPSLSGQQGNFNSLQQPPKDFWKKPGSYK